MWTVPWPFQTEARSVSPYLCFGSVCLAIVRIACIIVSARLLLLQATASARGSQVCHVPHAEALKLLFADVQDGPIVFDPGNTIGPFARLPPVGGCIAPFRKLSGTHSAYLGDAASRWCGLMYV